MMKERDIRDTLIYLEAQALHARLRQPASGQISDAVEVHACPDGRYAVFTGTFVDTLEGPPSTRICRTDLTSAETRVITFGPNLDRLPKVSPDGQTIAFLSDRHCLDDFQLYLLDDRTGQARCAPRVEGWVEYLHWSPDGNRILLGVAGHGADVSGAQGAITSRRQREGTESWMPSVATGTDKCQWRRVWIYELETQRMRPISRTNVNVWEASWCGNEALMAVISDGPGEDLWYRARLYLLKITSCHEKELLVPETQIGLPCAAPSGGTGAFVEGIASDRGMICGELRLIDVHSERVQRADTQDVDITFAEWRSEHRLLVAGHRGLETVIGVYDVVRKELTVTWRDRTRATSGFFISVSGKNDTGDCVWVSESFCQAPELAVIEGGKYRTVKSFDLGYAEPCADIKAVDGINWIASDGLTIQGWLLRPKAPAPHPLIMHVHGGPCWHRHPVWLGRSWCALLMLLKRGYAIFFPNPRGSTGRGQGFVRRLLGDLGGADARDCLSGIDHLIEQGIADPKRLGITGVSYGGFMTSWLITQDQRFSAAVPVAPFTNLVTMQLISNIPHFISSFVADTYTNFDGKYFQRSPVLHAQKVKTPTLSICGALDRCTPPEEAVQFHNALLANGINSVLVTYPQEGHGIGQFPALIDFTARVVDWFERHVGIPVSATQRGARENRCKVGRRAEIPTEHFQR